MMTSPIGAKLKRKTPSRLAKCLGMTLVEVLISVALLAGGAVLIIQAFAHAWEAAGVEDDRLKAYLFAVSKLSDLELAHHENHDLRDKISGSFRSGKDTFKWETHIEPAFEPPADSKEIPPDRLSFSVQWPRDEWRFETLLSPPKQETPAK